MARRSPQDSDWFESACDAWNRDEELETLDANHVRSLDALARKRHALVPQFDGEPLSTPPSTEYTSNQEKPAESHERPHSA